MTSPIPDRTPRYEALLRVVEVVRQAISRADDPHDMPSATVIPRLVANRLRKALAALAAIPPDSGGTKPGGFIEIPLTDYKRLLEAAEADDMIVHCEVCGAWLDRDDPATCTAEDFTGCWKTATHRAEHSHLCRSYRALT